jgi:hypothetical protein
MADADKDVFVAGPNAPQQVEVTRFLSSDNERQLFDTFLRELDGIQHSVAGLTETLAEQVEVTNRQVQASSGLPGERASVATAENVRTGGMGPGAGASSGMWPLSGPPHQVGEPSPASIQEDTQSPSGMLNWMKNFGSTVARDINPEYDPDRAAGAGAYAQSLLKYAGNLALPAAAFNTFPHMIGGISTALNPATLSSWGTELGTPPGSGATTPIPGVPFRVPWGAIGTGLSSYGRAAGQGISTPGLSTGQVLSNQAAVAGLGWFPGTSGYEPYTNALNEVTRQTGLDPNITSQMMDKATRLGQVGIDDFVESMKRVPEAARAAHVSFEQMQNDMNAMGEANQARGGTYFQGTQLAQQFGGLTGLPPSILPEAMQNPFVTAYATRTSGLMPQMQGIMDPGSQISSLYGAVNQMSKLTSFQGFNQRLPGAGGEFSSRYTGQDQNLAWLHTQFPELSPEVLANMTDPQKRRGVMAGANLLSYTEAWKQNVAQGKSGASSINPNVGKGDFGDVLHQARIATGPDGKPLLDRDAVDKIKYAGLDTGSLDGWTKSDGFKTIGPEQLSDATRQSALKQLHGKAAKAITALGDEDDQNRLLETSQGKKAIQQALTKSRSSALQDALNGRGGDSTGPKVTIELGTAAKQMFHLSSPQGGAKSKGGAGVTVGVNQGYSAPTQSPTIPWGG